MRTFWALATSALLSSTTAMGQQPPADAVTRYQGQIDAVLKNCSFLLVRQIEEANAGYVPDPKQKDDVPNCMRNGRQDVRQAFEAATKAQKKAAARDALKGVQVAFLAAMDGMAPETEERRAAYFARQGSLKAKVTEAWARFEVER